MHRVLRSLRGPLRLFGADAPLYFVLSAMLLLGVMLRVHQLGVPAVFKWDEHHYVETARSYLERKYAWNDHPPLSKLIIAAFMARLGDTPATWRLPSLLFGFADIGLVAGLTWVAFRSTRAALIAGAFVAADGFFIAYSRTALLDGMIVAFGVAALVCVLGGRTVWHALAAGLFAGCAISFKLNGIAFVGTGLLACLASRNLRRFAPLYLGAALLVFYAQAAFTLWLVGRAWSVTDVIAENRAMVTHHLSYTVVHPYSSHWYTWFLPVKPIYLRRDVDIDGSIRALLTLGNPLLWWGGIASVIVASVAVVRTGPARLWQKLRHLNAPESQDASLEDRAGQLFWLVAAWSAPIVFWIPSLRDSYIYHYMPSYPFALVLLAGLVESAYRKHRTLALLAIIAVAEVSVFYAPLWGELPITQSALDARLPFRSWR